MLNVFKNTDFQLVVLTDETYGSASVKIENRYGVAPELDLEVELTETDVHNLYNQLGKALGYPEIKNNV